MAGTLSVERTPYHLDVLPPPPSSSFASDNTAGVAPAALEALVAANEGPAVAYGDDAHTGRLRDQMNELLGREVTTLLAWGGTGANIVGLQALVRPWEAVICPASAHINVDECGAPERFLGAKLIDVDTPDGKLRPADIEAQLHVLGTVHHAQPGAVSVTQSTEYGTVYSVDELRAVIEVAKRGGLRVHMDGARIANAVAALDVPITALTTDLGVDVLSFGATKNGMAYGEAIVVLDPDLAGAATFLQKQAAQLPSKMRFVAAQFSALLDDDRWISQAAHANAMAQRLAAGAAAIPGVAVTQAPEANAVFVRLPADKIAEIQAWSWFYMWSPPDEVRWMTSFATTEDDVDRFLAGVREIVAG